MELEDIKKDIKKNNLKELSIIHDWRADLGEDWQKVNRKDKTDGMSKKQSKHIVEEKNPE